MRDEALAAVSETFGLAAPERYALWRARLEEDATTAAPLARTDLRDVQSQVRLDSLTSRTPRPLDARRVRRASDDDRPGWSRVDGSVAQRVTDALAAIRDNEHLNAFTSVFAEEALAGAAELDERAARGEDIGPLGGCVVAVKDLIDVQGHRTTGGTSALRGNAAVEDAPVLARLRAAGAVVIGTANLHALAYGALSTSSDFGPVGNPRRDDAIAGGSSGGSAAAVSAGLVDLALGTDTAGSIRIPSSLCGVVGLKATYGRMSTRGVQALGPSLDHVGPIARTVGEAAVALEVMSEAPFSAASTRWESLDGVRVGVPSSYFADHLDPEVRGALSSARAAVGELGGEVQEVDLPSAYLSPAAQLCTLSPEAFDVHRELLKERAHELPDDVRLRLEVGMFRSAPDYVRAQRVRQVMQSEMDAALSRTDVLLVPTLPVIAPLRDVWHLEVEGQHWTTQLAMTRLTMPFNLTGFPALTLPWAADSRGGSVGIQLAAGPMEEVRLLGAAHALERQRNGSTDGRRASA
jgi:Asp-tRNA(Asn)/Glu-tRNA(Gln) amidotransferase A subunit family amidase